MGNALAVRQVSWMDTFQKFVAEQQEKIREAERAQVPYMCLQEALETLEDMRIETFELKMHSDSVWLKFRADDRTTREEYWRIHKAVHDALVLRKQIEPGAGTYPSWADGDLTHISSWYCRKPTPRAPHAGIRVYLSMDVPEEGTYNIEVKKRYETYISEYAKYSLKFRDNLVEPPYQLGPDPKDIF